MKPGRVPQPSSYCGIEKGRNLWLEGRPPVNYGKPRFRLDKGSLAMATEILVKDLRQAFKHASSTVRWQRLDVFADTTRKLHPSTAARRFAMNGSAARSV
jgi:hypothetical protein